MKKTYKLIRIKAINFLILLGFLSLNLFGQTYLEIEDNFWGGGLSGLAKPAYTDLDNDGLLDMIVGEVNGSLTHYEQKEDSSKEFALINETFNGINLFRSSPIFINLNNNGLMDLLVGWNDGTIYYYEQSEVNSYNFTLITDEFSNIDVDYGSSPFIIDFNADGLLDLLVSDYYGTIHYYQQSSIGSTDFILINDTFIELSSGAALTSVVEDIDNDGLFDLLIGYSNDNLRHYEQDTVNSLNFELQSTSFSSLTVAEYSHPTFVDIDNNGLLDLVIGDDNGQVSIYGQDNLNSLSFSFDYNFRVDLGEYSNPCITDLDNDGLLDLVVGTNNTIALFEQSSQDTTKFNLITYDMLGYSFNEAAPFIIDLNNDGLLELIITSGSLISLWSQASIGSNSFNIIDSDFYGSDSYNKPDPCVADIDNDGLLDLLIGTGNSGIIHYEQNSTNSFEFTDLGPILYSYQVGNSASPEICDIDNDGLFDLIVGEALGTLKRFEQTSINSYTFDLITENFKDIDIGTYYSTPLIYDINNDGSFEIICGENNGGLHLYKKQPLIGDTIPVNLKSTVSNYYEVQLDWDYVSNLLYGDDIEPYTVGDFIAVENPTWWTTWANQPGSAEDIPVTDINANSGLQSLLVENTTDAVLKLGDKTSGIYQFSFYYYIPTGFGGYYNIQKFETPGTEFGQQVYFSEDGTGRLDMENYDVASFSYPKDSWFQVVNIIDLDNDWIRLYIDGYLIHEWPFSYSSSNTNGALQLGGCNFWAGAENGETPKYYLDDIEFREIYPSSKSSNKGLIGYNVYKNGINTGMVPSNEYLETSLPIGLYEYYTTAVFDNGESDPSYMVKVEIKGPPVSDFEAGITHISDGGTIHFSDLSAGTITNWEWDFNGDATIDSYDQNPQWTYNMAGTYTVSLITSDGINSNMETKTDYITVQADPLLINVPTDIYTIQGAIDASYHTDTVLVQPGTYYENINFNGKNIVLASMILFTNDTSYISQTIIDGGGNGSVVTMYSNENSITLFAGFTIMNGSNGSGGGIYLGNTDPIISNVIITNNIATYNGGGIYINQGAPIIKESKIMNNTAGGGGGLYFDRSNSTILLNNIISNNYASANGGGIYLYRSSPRITNNLISDNWSDDPSSGAGGIRCNDDASPILINNTIVNNSGTYGGGLRVMGNSDPVLINNILWGNTATVSGNQIRLDDDTSDPDFIFCDVEGGVAGFGIETGETFTGTYDNCIEADPLFADYLSGNFQLTDLSPCRNSGNPNPIYNDPDGTIADIGAFYYEQTTPFANFGADVTEGYIPVEVNFTDLSVSINSPIVQWDWDFGDGATSANQNPTHIYQNLGSYTVSLIITAENSNTDTLSKTFYITVYDTVITSHALQFDGSNDFVQALAVPFPSDGHTIEAWIYPSTVSVRQEIVYFYDDTTSVQLRINSDGSLLYGELYNSTFNLVQSPGSSIPVNEWTHVAITKQGNECNLYINGIHSGYSQVDNNPTADNLVIGARLDYTDRFFEGNIDEVRIWTVARSQSEIQANMSNYLSASETGLYTYYNMNTGWGSLISDLSGNNYNGQLGSSLGWNFDDPTWVATNWPYFGVDLMLNLKAYLQGPFNNTEMNIDLNNSSYIPFTQPYNNSPWNYNGSESVASIPNNNVVDWVLIELRDATDAASALSATTIENQAAFLLKDGSIVGLDGTTNLQFNASITQQLFAIIYHRNHISIMSASQLIESGGIYTYDFTDDASKTFGGEKGQTEIATGVWGMMASDADANGQIDNLDKNDHWLLQEGSSGYLEGDFDMSGTVNTFDKDKWGPNSGKGSQVPD